MSVGPEVVQHEPLPEVDNEVEQPQKKGRTKRFVGGFVSNLMSVPKLMSRGRNPPQAAPQPTPQPARPPRPTIIRTPPSGPLGPLNPSPRALATEPPQTTEPLRLATPSPARSSVPSYAQEDSVVSSGSGPSSHGPRTPPQRGATNLEDLPNPHDSKFDATPVISDPERVNMQLTADYDAMTDPDFTTSGGESTFSSRVNNVGKMINDFANLPWIGSTVATVYSPFESRRARYRDVKQPGVSWYTKEIPEKVDLLATSPQPRRRRTRPAEPQPNATAGPSHPRRHQASQPSSSKRSRDANTAPRRTHKPASTSSGEADMPSPSASSHSHGQHPYPYAYYPPPQPFYIYSPQASPNGGQTHEVGPMPGTAVPIPAAPHAMPVYLIAAPAMPMLPGSPVEGHGHRHHSPQMIPQFPVPMPAPSPVAPLSPPHSSSPRTRHFQDSPPTIPALTMSPPRAARSPPVASSSGSGAGLQPQTLLSPRNSNPKPRTSS